MAYMVFMGALALPTTPSKITTSVTNKNETITLIDGTEINPLKKGGLTEVSFEFLLPHQTYPYIPRLNSAIANAVTAAVSSYSAIDQAKSLYENGLDFGSFANIADGEKGLTKMWEQLNTGEFDFGSLGTCANIVNSASAAVASVAGMFGSDFGVSGKTAFLLGQLEYLKQSQEPFYFIVVRKGEGAFDFVGQSFTFMKASLEDYTIKEDAAEYGLDVAVEVNLKQYKEYKTRKETVTKTSNGTKTKSSKSRSSTPSSKKNSFEAKKAETIYNSIHDVTTDIEVWVKDAVEWI